MKRNLYEKHVAYLLITIKWNCEENVTENKSTVKEKFRITLEIAGEKELQNPCLKYNKK